METFFFLSILSCFDLNVKNKSFSLYNFQDESEGQNIYGIKFEIVNLAVNYVTNNIIIS
jgi:hypothetical protein